MLVLVDDAQWLDQALGGERWIARARPLPAARAAVLAAARDEPSGAGLPGLLGAAGGRAGPHGEKGNCLQGRDWRLRGP